MEIFLRVFVEDLFISAVLHSEMLLLWRFFLNLIGSILYPIPLELFLRSLFFDYWALDSLCFLFHWSADEFSSIRNVDVFIFSLSPSFLRHSFSVFIQQNRLYFYDFFNSLTFICFKSLSQLFIKLFLGYFFHIYFDKRMDLMSFPNIVHDHEVINRLHLSEYLLSSFDFLYFLE